MEVKALVGVLTSDGVITKNVGELRTGAEVRVAEIDGRREGVAVPELTLSVGVIAGMDGFGEA